MSKSPLSCSAVCRLSSGPGPDPGPHLPGGGCGGRPAGTREHIANNPIIVIQAAIILLAGGAGGCRESGTQLHTDNNGGHTNKNTDSRPDKYYISHQRLSAISGSGLQCSPVPLPWVQCLFTKYLLLHIFWLRADLIRHDAQTSNRDTDLNCFGLATQASFTKILSSLQDS